MRTAKAPITLGGCPGWSESSLGAYSFCWFCHDAAQMERERTMTRNRNRSTALEQSVISEDLYRVNLFKLTDRSKAVFLMMFDLWRQSTEPFLVSYVLITLVCILLMSPTEGEGDLLFLVRILLASALASASAWHFLVCTISHGWILTKFAWM